MTLQGKIALIHFAAVAVLFATLNNASLSVPGLEGFCWYGFLILIFPIGFIGLPATLACQCGETAPYGIIFAGATFALNSYLWAWVIVRLTILVRGHA